MVQGNKTEQSVLNALETLEILDLELVLILRGGGSKTDLFSLDNPHSAASLYCVPKSNL
jgi:exodeoxyribonuclease VII large subunit